MGSTLTNNFTIEGCLNNIGKKVRKVSHRNNTNQPKPFKSTFIFNTIKDVINHPILNVPAYTFNEDDSYVEVRRCVIIE